MWHFALEQWVSYNAFKLGELLLVRGIAMVVGTVALMLSLNPEADVGEIKTALLSNASVDKDASWPITTLCVSGGELNAQKALTQAVSNFATYSLTAIGDSVNGTSVDDDFVVKINSSTGKVQVLVNGIPLATGENLRGRECIK